MVGLPARGKTYCARKLCRYLQWLGITTRVFNVGNYRRQQYGACHTHRFFDPANAAATEQRRHAAMAALEDMSAWMAQAEGRTVWVCVYVCLCVVEGVGATVSDTDMSSTGTTGTDMNSTGTTGTTGTDLSSTGTTDVTRTMDPSNYTQPTHTHAHAHMVVAIYDATNSTRDRRAMIHAHGTQHGIAPLFIESICTDPELILANIREVDAIVLAHAGLRRLGLGERATEVLGEDVDVVEHHAIARRDDLPLAVPVEVDHRGRAQPALVPAVGELHEQDANIACHGDQHLSEAFSLLVFFARKVESSELGHTVDQSRDLGAELLLDVRQREVGVLGDAAPGAAGGAIRAARARGRRS